MNSGQISSHLIEDIYAAALGEIGWDISLKAIRLIAGACTAVLLTTDFDTLTLRKIGASSDDEEWAAAVCNSYRGEYLRLNLLGEASGNWSSGGWRETTAAPNGHGISFQEFAHPQGLGKRAGISFQLDYPGTAVLALLHAPGSAISPAEGFDRIKELSRHLGRAIHLQRRLRGLTRRTVISESTLDSIGRSAFLLSEDRRLLWTNAAGRKMMAGVLEARFTEDRFSPAPLDVPGDWEQVRKKGAIAIQRAGRRPLIMTVQSIALAPLSQEGPLPILLLEAPLSRSRGELAQHLKVAYSLTQAETELSIMLAHDGLTPQTCAETRRVSIATIRSQIRAIQLKTNASGLSDLVRLVLTL